MFSAYKTSTFITQKTVLYNVCILQEGPFLAVGPILSFAMHERAAHNACVYNTLIGPAKMLSDFKTDLNRQKRMQPILVAKLSTT